MKGYKNAKKKICSVFLVWTILGTNSVWGTEQSQPDTSASFEVISDNQQKKLKKSTKHAQQPQMKKKSKKKSDNSPPQKTVVVRG